MILINVVVCLVQIGSLNNSTTQQANSPSENYC